jgi:YD repeat-containing protein
VVTTNWLNGQFDYNYDDADRLTGLTLPNEVTSSYDYDPAGRLILLSHTTPDESLASYAYDLDRAGNRTTLTETLVSMLDVPAGAYLEDEGQVVIEAEQGRRTNGLTHSWLRLTSQSTRSGHRWLHRHILLANLGGPGRSLPTK